MDFRSARGACELVSADDAGERLQGFAARAFREHLLQRGDSRKQAHQAASEGRLLVNDATRPGHHVLCASDVVTLVAPPHEAAQSGLPRRMVVSLEDADAGGGRGGAQGLRGALAASAGALAFRDYYRAQRLCSAAQWEAAFAALLQPLPLSVRFNLASQTRRFAAEDVELAAAAASASTAPVPWLGSEHALQLAPGAVERGFAPAFSELVSRAAAVGELCQQEAASMLPPALLAPILPTHHVLDLCCAPASKTSQLLDMMAAAAALLAAEGGGAATSTEGGGLLIANDLETPRAERALRRLWTQHSAAAVVTHGDARSFIPPSLGTSGPPLRFDRVLVDAPCSGDGTLRKNPEKWPRWTVWPAVANHALQLQILRRALALLAPGGRLAYSTCSLNPLECEAVVAAALREANSAGAPGAPGAPGVPPRRAGGPPEFALLSASDALPARARGAITPGVSEWLVPVPALASSADAARGGEGARGGNWVCVRTYQEAERVLGEGAGCTDGAEGAEAQAAAGKPTPRILPTMFAPPPDRRAGGEGTRDHARNVGASDGGCGGVDGDASQDAVDLSRCARVLPTGADCGAFFAALIARRAASVPPDAPSDHQTLRPGTRPAPAADLPAPADALFAPLCALSPDAEAQLRAFFALPQQPTGPPAQTPLALAVCVTRALRAALERAGSPLARERAAELEPLAPLVVSVPPALLRLSTRGGAEAGCAEEEAGGAAGAGAAFPARLAVLGGGIPTFSRMPAGARWPAERPWRVCQQAAAMLGARAARRVLWLCPQEYVRFLRAARCPNPSELAALGRLRGWAGCCRAPDGGGAGRGRGEAAPRDDAALEPEPECGAVVVGIAAQPSEPRLDRPSAEPEPCPRAGERAPPALYVAAVLIRADGPGPGTETAGLGLELLAGADVARRYEEVARRLYGGACEGSRGGACAGSGSGRL